MEPALQDQLVEKDAKPAFRKPVNDASSRRYRRHSPGAGSDVSSDDDDKTGRTHDNVSSKQDEAQRVYKKRNDDEADKDRDYHSKSRRGHESYKQPDRYSSGSSHGYRRHDDYGNRGYRDADIDDRNYRRPSQSSRDVRDSNYSSHGRREHTHEKYRENPRSSGDRYSRDKSDSGYRIKVKDRDARQHLNDKDSGPQRRHVSSLNDNAKSLELERLKERGVRDDRKEYHRGADSSKNDLDNASSHHRESTKEGQDNSLSKRKHDETEYKKHRDMHSEEEEHPKNGKNFSNEHVREKRNFAEDEPHLSKLKPTVEDDNIGANKERTSKFSTEPGVFSTSQVDVAQDLGAAKFAAMKAAEIVNRNLIGGGLSTTEQKKKLLWGNKKTIATEESTSQWDLSLFPDRERQEKFKKLMSLRLHWCLWPLVGCERRPEVGAQTGGQRWQPPSREAEGVRDGSGEAVHRRTPPKRRTNCRPWTVKRLMLVWRCFVSKMYEFCPVVYLLLKIYFSVGTVNLLALSAFHIKFINHFALHLSSEAY